jgi:hypothetical protein
MVVHAPAAKAEGIGERRVWKGICDDQIALMAAIVSSDPRYVVTSGLTNVKVLAFPLKHLVPVRGGPDEFKPIFELGQAVLDHYARRQQDSMAIPGCHAEQEFGLSVKKG